MHRASMPSGRTSSTQRSAFETSKKVDGQVQLAISTGRVGPVKAKKGSLIPKSEPSLKALSSIGAVGVNLRERSHKSIHVSFGLLLLPQMRLNKRAMMENRRTLTVRGAAWCSPTLSAAKIETFPTFEYGQITLPKWQRSTDCQQVASRPLPTS